MTWEDAFKTAKSGTSYDYQEKCVLALSKQVPQAPWRRSEKEPLICPVCLRSDGLGYFVKNNYCSVCGQRLDWGKVTCV